MDLEVHGSGGAWFWRWMGLKILKLEDSGGDWVWRGRGLRGLGLEEHKAEEA